jgi:uncharacterized protein (DUF1697 family)
MTTRYIAILRGINVGGKRKIIMAELRALLESIHLKNVNTYIQSGNIVFEHNKTANSELEELISNTIKTKYGFDVPCIVRTAAEWQRAIDENPFANDHEVDQLHLTFLKELPANEKIEAIADHDFSPDSFQVINQNVYLLVLGKYHKTKLSNQFFESKLKVEATTRNWKTVMKLMEMASND